MLLFWFCCCSCFWFSQGLRAKGQRLLFQSQLSSKMTDMMRPSPRTNFLTVLIVILCLAGVVIASLALGEHYNTGSSPCSINDVWDCGTVNHSPYAVMFGVPVAIIGIVGYALLAALAGRFPGITAAGALVGLIFS